MNEESASYCRLKAREHDADAYLAALFAAEPVRQDLWALQAFAAELARIPALVSEPMLGEIRLQWWRDALDGLFAGQLVDHPVIVALAEAHARAPLRREPLTALIDARGLALYPDAIVDDAALERHIGARGAGLLQLAVERLEPSRDPALSALIETGGRVLGLKDLLRRRGEAAPLSAALRARLGALAGEGLAALAEARAGFTALRRPGLLPAFLLVGLAEPLLRRAARPGADPLLPAPEPPLYRRQLRLMAMALSGRI
jgi:15-cis-phytoene synthase